MKIFTYTLTFMMLAISAHAASITWLPAYLAEKNYIVVADMPCNWDRKLENVFAYAYYGEQGDHQVFVDIEKERPLGGQNIAVKFNREIASPVDGKPLHHVDVEYQTTNRSCETGYDPYRR